MVVYQAEARAASRCFLFRLVDIANELFAMAAPCRAPSARRSGHPEAAEAARLADLFCRGTRRKVRGLFRALWHNDDAPTYARAARCSKGEHAWLEEGGIPLGLTVEDLKPRLPAHAVLPAPGAEQKRVPSPPAPTVVPVA